MSNIQISICTLHDIKTNSECQLKSMCNLRFIHRTDHHPLHTGTQRGHPYSPYKWLTPLVILTSGQSDDDARCAGRPVAVRPQQGWDLPAAGHQTTRSPARLPQEDHPQGQCCKSTSMNQFGIYCLLKGEGDPENTIENVLRIPIDKGVLVCPRMRLHTFGDPDVIYQFVLRYNVTNMAS